MLIGITMMLNIKLTWRGSTRVPTVSPSDPASMHDSGKHGDQDQRVHVQGHGRARHQQHDRERDRGGDRGLDRARHDLLHRHPHTGSGAITRSSISRVYPNSETSGSATAWMPWKIRAKLIRPGASNVENCVLALLGPADALPDLREHVREHERRQQRLHDGADEERADLLAHDANVATPACDERGEAAAPRPRWCERVGEIAACMSLAQVLAVSEMKTVSSVGIVTPRR